MSSQLSSCTKPTWLASMKHGSHIMLQRFVRSTVSTEPAAVLDRAAAVVVQRLVVVRLDVAPGERLLEVLEHRRVDRHHVLEMPVQRAVLDHEDLAVALEDRRLDLADLLGQQNRHVLLAVDDRLARFAHAHRTQRVGFTRPAQRRLGLLPRLVQRLIRPFRRERRTALDRVQSVEHVPHAIGGDGHTLLDVLDRSMHCDDISWPGTRMGLNCLKVKEL